MAEAAHHRPPERWVGIGWRQPHERELMERLPPLASLEVHSENFFGDGGPALAALCAARAHYPVSLHGVGLGLGSAAGLDPWHLDRLAALVERIEPVRVSDHACFARVATPAGPVVHAADLLPIAFTEASLDILATHVAQVQDRLQRPLLVENIASWMAWADADMDEPDFFNALTRRTGCGLLLDLNNLMVNAMNRGESDALAACRGWVDRIDATTVGEIHLAGHDASGELVIDDHGAPVPPAVWTLFQHAAGRLGPRPTVIEWDTRLPALDTLLAEAQRAEMLWR
jgi:uncharacterized protein (UPF0276 family)